MEREQAEAEARRAPQAHAARLRRRARGRRDRRHRRRGPDLHRRRAAADGPSKASDTASTAKLPEQATSDIKAAAKAAGCTLNNPAYEGANHEEKDFKASDYKTNPPTSGNHTPDWYEDGIYAPGDTPELGKLVHPLEHGRIEVQYKKGTDAETVGKLEALLAEQSRTATTCCCSRTRPTWRSAVAATAWTHSLTCPEMNDKVFDAIRTFRARYIDKGPERVP